LTFYSSNAGLKHIRIQDIIAIDEKEKRRHIRPLALYSLLAKTVALVSVPSQLLK
jgi:hypothetical protein